jgi:ectoine hydroxylase-related dioxygenase (phytanoyl-CoA dioxygenase family)
MAQLYGSTAENGVWVLPGSHSGGHRHDIVGLEKAHGDRFPGALPMIAAPGDVCIASRMALHCSYPNVSHDKRITLNLGWQTSRDAAEQNQSAQRSRLIPIAIAARSARFPDEASFVIPKDNPGAAHDPQQWGQPARYLVSELS